MQGKFKTLHNEKHHDLSMSPDIVSSVRFWFMWWADN